VGPAEPNAALFHLSLYAEVSSGLQSPPCQNTSSLLVFPLPGLPQPFCFSALHWLHFTEHAHLPEFEALKETLLYSDLQSKSSKPSDYSPLTSTTRVSTFTFDI